VAGRGLVTSCVAEVRQEAENAGDLSARIAGITLAMGPGRSLKESPMLAQNENRPPLPTCKCGTDRTHREATPEREYTFMGTLYALWGGTSVPSRVNFRCVRCGVVFDGRSDTATRRAFII
jgi:hypothetical protein